MAFRRLKVFGWHCVAAAFKLAAGVVRILHRGPGLPPLVTHLWYPVRD